MTAEREGSSAGAVRESGGLNELCLGIISETSQEKFRNIIESLAKQGAQGVILGCTEIGMLISQKDTDLPVFDTTQIHATKAARLSIG